MPEKAGGGVSDEGEAQNRHLSQIISSWPVGFSGLHGMRRLSDQLCKAEPITTQ